MSFERFLPPFLFRNRFQNKKTSGPDDGDNAPPLVDPLVTGEVEVIDLGDGKKIVVIGTNEGDKMTAFAADKLPPLVSQSE